MCSGRGYHVLGDFPMHDVFFGYSYEEHVLRSVLVERANGLKPLARPEHSTASVGNKSRVGLGYNKNA